MRQILTMRSAQVHTFVDIALGRSSEGVSQARPRGVAHPASSAC
jgi:hypothetical protein